MRRGFRTALVAAGLAVAAACQGSQPAGGDEPATALYEHPEPIEIAGYSGSAMEPFLSSDGKFLFFNSEESEAANKAMHFAVRTGPAAFRHLGELSGVNSHDRAIVEGVPSLDSRGRFYFTSTRSFARDGHSILAGRFDGKAVIDAAPVEGGFNPRSPGLINMDGSISADGETFYVSRTQFDGGPMPRASDLAVAHRVGERFELDPRSAELLRAVNGPALEYAPAISADGLELYFTRASTTAGFRLMVARRASKDAAFGKPCVLSALAGFVEAPSPSLDGSALYFHKKVGPIFRIFRATRNRQAAPCGIGR